MYKSNLSNALRTLFDHTAKYMPIRMIRLHIRTLALIVTYICCNTGCSTLVGIASLVNIFIPGTFTIVEQSPAVTTITPAYTSSTVQPASSSVTTYSEADRMIKATLGIVAQKYKAKQDCNGDGLTNCIDAAVWFYQYYPVRNDVCIESNSMMSHAFNCVKMDGVWRAIEPQAYATGWDVYFMSNIWGKEYEPYYNYDSTYKYSRYVR
jgi:hypothetical protein